MFKHQLDTNRGGFSLIATDPKTRLPRRDHLYRPEQVLEPVSALMHSVSGPGYGLESSRRSEFAHPRMKHESVS